MSTRTHRTILAVVMLLSLILQPSAAAATPPGQAAPAVAAPSLLPEGPGYLFRVAVTADSPSRRARLAALGVTALGEGAEEQGNGEADVISSAAWLLRTSAQLVVLADADQLADLARLGFRPQAADELRLLVRRQGPERRWLAASLEPLLAQADAIAAPRAAAGIAGAAAAPDAAAQAALRAALAALTPAQLAAVADSVSVDDDGDGLTNTEEAWWCTDPLNPNSDGDAQGFTDGQEVHALLDFTLPRNVRWGYGPPFGPPNAWPNFNDRLGTHVNVCNDGDWDTIPDYAEVYMVGTRVPEESTDRDKFDDGQELFGITYCPGAPTNCGYGSYPAIEYWNFIQARVPDWVLPPGDNPLVAAFPVPEVYVTPGSWRVERVTTITTSEGQMTQTSHTYETSVTRGQSTSIANTVTWNNWEEVSQAVETPLAVSSVVIVRTPQGFWNRVWGGVQMVGGAALAVGTVVACGTATAITIGGAAVPCAPLIAGAAVVGGALVGEGWGDLTDPEKSPENIQNNYYRTSNYNDFSYNPDYYDFSQESYTFLTLNQQLDSQGIVNSLDGVQYAINKQGALLARGLQDISYQLSRPRYTETRTNGKSWGGAQTTTHEVYEEHTQTEGVGFTTGQNWSTAWAVDSSHAADLTFEFTVKNTGTEYARELTGIVINVYIGDDTSPAISYPAWQKFPGGKLENLFPVGPNTPPGQFSTRTFTTDRIPLSLEQMKRIDLGERLTVKVESYSYGADELFYTNAVSGGVTVFIEDGVEDGDESVDSYVIPTWGVESVQDVLTRYFRCPPGQTCTDADGNLNALWTPEFDGVNPPTWREHYLSDIAWWNVYLTQADAGDTPLKDLPARAGSGILFRFNRDSDRDGYNDRAEFHYYCALPTDDPDRARCADAHLRPEIHPQPEVAAGYVAERSGNVVTVKLAVANTGTFDAYGIDAVMYSPDGTTTIGNNTVGGNGRVRPGNHVAVGSLIKPPDLANWGASTAKPYAGGQFSGAADRTFTFTAETAGVVGQAGTSVRWSDGAGGGGVIPLGSSYHAPLPVDVAQGLQVGFNTGTIMPGTHFTVEALTPRDTFTYTINSEPFTPPVIVVSYSDPQGSHRFVTPVALPRLDAGIAAGQMLEGLKLDIVTPAAFNAAGANTTNLVVNSPHPAAIQAGRLYLNFVSDGKRVLEKSYTLDIPAGPTVFPADWSVAEFSADYHPDGDNLLIAFWTDSEGNIIDSAARPLNSFAEDPKPAFAMSDADATWDFGAAAQGTLLTRRFTFANTGALDLLTYVSAPAGLTVSQTGSRRVGMADMTTYEMTLNTANLPEGPYDAAVTIRTSDPANPTRTVHVTGMVTAAPADTPMGALQRPLDWPATVSGNQGDWVEFAHTLGPEPQTLHPVKVYSQDYATLKGVGKYATPFGAGTASYDMFGDGRDGVMPSSGNLDYNNGVGVGVVNSGSAGSYTINVTDVYAVWRINPGDVVLIHQTQGANAGCWELNKAVSDFGGGAATYQLAQPLRCNYASGGNNHAQIQRVPQYTNCPVSGTVTPLAAWNGTWGGILAVMCSGTMNVTGSVNGAGYGFRGGNRGEYSAPVRAQGWQGESYSGPGAQTRNANGGGGGGGEGDNKVGCPTDGKCGGAGGGGGGHSSSGANGLPGGDKPSQPGYGGGVYGVTDLAGQNHLGSGGGGGGSDDGDSSPGGAGGPGGGIIFLSSRYLSVTGSVLASGGVGQPGSTNGRTGGGGGGSGGSIFLRGSDIALASSQVLALGQAGGSGANRGGSGGAGGLGRIRVEYCNTLSGTTNPAASTQKLNCYLAEQVESAPYTATRLNLPETGTHTYQVQYGRKLNYTGAAALVPTLRVPAGMFSSVTVQALVSDLTSNAFLNIDVGNTGTSSWSGTVSNNSENTSPNLAAFFNAYWASHGAPTTGYLDVPIRVYLDRAGQVLLTNLQVTPAGSKTRAIRLPVRPQGYSSVTAGFTVSGGTGPLAVGVDVGGDGSVDWTWSGTPAYPAHLTAQGAQFTAAINTYLAAVGGQPSADVPIRFYLAPFATLTLTGLSATPVGGTDAGVADGDVTFGNNTPTEGDTVAIHATIHNGAALDAGPLTASFYAIPPSIGGAGGAWYIGSAFVPSIASSSQLPASISWNTLGFTGDIPVRVVVDPYNRVAELSETNNVATATLTIKTRPDLSIPALALSDDEPAAGRPVTVTATLRNSGQTAAGSQTTTLYNGNPDAGGTPVETLHATSLQGGATMDLTFTWTPAKPGPYRLFTRADRTGAVNESDEGNNDAWRDVYVGFAGPIRVDAGAASDRAYTAAAGFGYLNTGTRTVSCGGSAAPDATLRAAITNTLLYRFDHLLPGHFYHLDLTLRDCDGNRAEEVWVDGMPVAPAADLSDHQPRRLSLLLDPALYRDRTITAAIVETHGLDAQAAEISLHDVDYRYADAGHSSDPADPADPRYPGPAAARAKGRAYGWLDGERLASWGNLPGQTVRMDRSDDDPTDDPDSELRYRFDGLDPARRYRLRLTFRQLSGASVIQKVQLDGTDATPSFTLASGQAYSLTVAVPSMAYDADGSIVVGVVRVDCAASEAQVNEIALEEETLPAGNPCNVRPTPNRTLAAGRATIRGVPAPAGAVIEAVTPRNEVVGCAVVSTAGEYPLMQIYGADPTIPGMRDGEIVEFRVNGIPAVAQPSLYWKNDSTPHTVDLSIGSTEGQCSWLASGWNLFSFRLDPPVPTVEKALGAIGGRYCQVRGERAAYDCTQEPVYRTLKELDPGQSYWLKLEGSAGANLRIEGMSTPITTPLPLHQYWNWVGYLPSAAQPITAALQSIAGRYLLVLSKDKTYDPNNPGRSTLWTLEPGQGYQIRATEAVTLVYPSAVSAAGLPPVPEDAGPGAAACAHISPTPFLTLLYGQARLGAAPAPAGAVIEIITPRGEVAGCTVVRTAGEYGYVHVYGEDSTDPPVPGFREGEPLAFRINGVPVASTPALTWQNDRTPHAADLAGAGWAVWLPLVVK